MPPDYDIPILINSRNAFWAYKDKSPQNAGLTFDRFSPRLDNVSSGEKSGEIKKKAFNQVIAASKKIDHDLFKAWVERWKMSANAVSAKPFRRVSDWRFVAGLGRKGSLETGFTFNHYGFPYLPGSSVKGLARMSALVNLAEHLNTDKLNMLDEILAKETQEAFVESFSKITEYNQALDLANTFRKIFGTPSQAGCAIFMDAIPEQTPILQLDIMNPHYPDYYQEKAPPTNWQSPQPIYFLTVAGGIPFLFGVGWRHGIQVDAGALKQAYTWLDMGLQNLGAGAKTSAGYGYFSQELEPPAPLPIGYQRGVVVSFGEGPNKSYGHILPDGAVGSDLLFVHRNGLEPGLMNLEPGQHVIFKRVKVPNKDDQAQDVKIDE